LAVVGAIVVVIVFVTQPSGHKRAPTPNTTRPAPVQPGRLDSLLLGAADVGTIVGAPNLEIANQTQQMRQPVGNLSNLDCLGAFDPIMDSVYRTAVLPGSAASSCTRGNNAFRVYEAPVSFPNAEKAHAFVATSADKWKGCADQAVTMATQGKTYTWTFGELTGAAPKIRQPRPEANGSGRGCQHALSAVSDVVIDVQACATNIADQAARSLSRWPPR
jgi:serine/threonine kinase PknH